MSTRIPLPFPTARVLVVSDFNCPYCFTLNEWVHRIGAGNRVRWLGIEHRPDLPTSGMNQPSDQATLAREVSDVQNRAPEVGVVRPARWLNSRRALLLQNAVEDDFPEIAPALRRAIFKTYWSEGADLDDVRLNRIAGELGLPSVDTDPGLLDETSAWWRSELDRVPCMLGPTGVAHLGLQDFRAVRSFLNSALRAGTVGAGCQ